MTKYRIVESDKLGQYFIEKFVPARNFSIFYFKEHWKTCWEDRSSFAGPGRGCLFDSVKKCEIFIEQLSHEGGKVLKEIDKGEE